MRAVRISGDLKGACVAVLASAVATGVLAAPAQARVAKPRVVRPVATAPGPAHFGVHQPGVAYGAWPKVPRGTVGSVRLWDSGTSWKEVNPARGVFVWAALDAAVANARAHGASVDLVLGQTPAWAALDPGFEPRAAYGSGATSPVAVEADWVAYVQAVARRYKGAISAYETWNEGNLWLFWGGTPAQLARLNSLAYRTIKSIDPKAVVVAPSSTLRQGHGWLVKYAKAGGFRYSDAINVHAYPRPEAGPEDGIALVNRARATLKAMGIVKPVWNTEMNYGMPVGGVGRHPLPPDKQSAYVTRTYLLAQSNQIARTYWYAWGNAPYLGVSMTSADGLTNARAAKAFTVVVGWMHGRSVPCVVDRAGTYTCTIAYAKGKGVVRWNPKKAVTVLAPKYTRSRQDVYGRTVRARGAWKVRIGYSPVLFRTSR